MHGEGVVIKSRAQHQERREGISLRFERAQQGCIQGDFHMGPGGRIKGGGLNIRGGERGNLREG